MKKKIREKACKTLCNCQSWGWHKCSLAHGYVHKGQLVKLNQNTPLIDINGHDIFQFVESFMWRNLKAKINWKK